MGRHSVGGSYAYSVVCDRCGFIFKNHQLRKEWTGAMVCHGSGTNDCWEPRNEQDLIRVRSDTHVLPYTRPEPEGIDVSPTFNCDGLLEDIITNTMFNNLLLAQGAITYDVYKVKTFGGTVTVPDGMTLVVKCTLEIQP